MIDYSGISNSSLGFRAKSLRADLGKALYDANRDKPGAAERARNLAARLREVTDEMKRRGWS